MVREKMQTYKKHALERCATKEAMKVLAHEIYVDQELAKETIRQIAKSRLSVSLSTHYTGKRLASSP